MTEAPCVRTWTSQTTSMPRPRMSSTTLTIARTSSKWKRMHLLWLQRWTISAWNHLQEMWFQLKLLALPARPRDYGSTKKWRPCWRHMWWQNREWSWKRWSVLSQRPTLHPNSKSSVAEGADNNTFTESAEIPMRCAFTQSSERIKRQKVILPHLLQKMKQRLKTTSSTTLACAWVLAYSSGISVTQSKKKMGGESSGVGSLCSWSSRLTTTPSMH